MCFFAGGVLYIMVPVRRSVPLSLAVCFQFCV